jgi:hypothetical protein
MQYEKLNEKYYFLRKDKNPNSLFASFSFFKKIGTGSLLKYDQRPPYPIIIDNPTHTEVFNNLNKSDLLVGMTFVAAGFTSSILATRRFHLIDSKFMVTKYMMNWYSLIGMFVAMSCSYYRLTGLMENGLRWKTKDILYSKYDLTSDFEKNTIFKHFRERID